MPLEIMRICSAWRHKPLEGRKTPYLLYTQDVRGSNPLPPTRRFARSAWISPCGLISSGASLPRRASSLLGDFARRERRLQCREDLSSSWRRLATGTDEAEWVESAS